MNGRIRNRRRRWCAGLAAMTFGFLGVAGGSAATASQPAYCPIVVTTGVLIDQTGCGAQQT